MELLTVRYILKQNKIKKLLKLSVSLLLLSCNISAEYKPISELRGRVVADLSVGSAVFSFKVIGFKNDSTGTIEYYKIIKLDSKNLKVGDTIK